MKGCPKMKIFSTSLVTTPKLKSVKVEDNEWHWQDDLNTTIQVYLERHRVCTNSTILLIENDLRSLLTMSDNSTTIREACTTNMRGIYTFYLYIFILIMDFLFVFLYLNDISIPN